MRLGELAAFCRRMGIGLRAGVNILKLLENETRTSNPRHRRTMQSMHERVQAGNSLAKAMLEEKKYFPPLLIQLVHASELGGRVEHLFEYMAGYYSDLKKTRSEFLSKISWPMFELGMAVVIIGVVILIQAMLSPGENSYDATAMGFRGLGGFYRYCLFVLIIFGTLAVTAYGLWKNWFNCHRTLMPLVQRIPLLGTSLVTLGLARLSMALSMLLNAGVEARRSVKQAFLSTGNYYFISGMDRALESIDQGHSFGDAFAASKVLPEEFVETIRIGELSGTETESLDHLAEQYRLRGQAALSTLATICGTTIMFSVMLLLAIVIVRMGMQYIGILSNPMG